MQDAPASREETPASDKDDDVADSPAPESDDAVVSEKEPSPPIVQPFPRKKRLGRPPKNRPPDWNNTPEPAEGGASDRGTPVKRKRGRPAGGGGTRGRPRGGPSHVTKVPIDKEGNMMEVIDDEVALPEDPDGEEKVDKLGNLKGGREYRVRTFTIMGRGQRLYMLSTEPARCTGFRDSYLFFTKHMQLFKIIVDEAEKRDLIDREIIPHSYKGRAIGVVTARSVFREFGARIIVGGKRIIDDYYIQAARARGDIEGEIADPNDRLPPPGEPYNRNQYVAWHGASAVYHTGGPSVPLQPGKGLPKKKIPITSANWQFEHARSARYAFFLTIIIDRLLTRHSRFNSTLVFQRRANMDGVYDSHTNLMSYPRITQPTHAKWEEIPHEPLTDGKSLTNGVNELTNGVKSVSLNHEEPHRDTIFGPVSSVVARNFLVTDLVYQSPSMSGLGIPGPDGNYYDVGPNGLASVPDDVLDVLPPECRQAYEDAKAKETEWRNTWRSETEDGHRAHLKIGFSGVPV
jgi:chromatin structure-remodeling complex protein RSC7